MAVAPKDHSFIPNKGVMSDFCRVCGSDRDEHFDCDHVGESRTNKFNGGNPVTLCGRCSTILHYLDGRPSP